MPTIVYQINPKTGVKYAYESISYWDKDKKAPRSKRKYLGRVDPETGEIIKGARNRRKEDSALPQEGEPGVQELREELARKDAELAALRSELAEMSSRYENASMALARIHALADQYSTIQ